MKDRESCINLFPYHEATEFSRRVAYAYREEDGFDESFDMWDSEMIGFWFGLVNKKWTLQESLDETIISVFDMLNMPYDDADVSRLYGLNVEEKEIEN